MASKPIPNDFMNSDKYLCREVRGKLYYIHKSKFIEICNELDKDNEKRGGNNEHKH